MTEGLPPPRQPLPGVDVAAGWTGRGKENHMSYEVCESLTIDRNPDGSEELSCDPFFVAEEPLLRWYEDGGEPGGEEHYLYPAFANSFRRSDQGPWGVRSEVVIDRECWLHCWDWQAAIGYKASGGGRELLTFEEGIALLTEKSALIFPEPSPEEAEALRES